MGRSAQLITVIETGLIFFAQNIISHFFLLILKWFIFCRDNSGVFGMIIMTMFDIGLGGIDPLHFCCCYCKYGTR